MKSSMMSIGDRLIPALLPLRVESFRGSWNDSWLGSSSEDGDEILPGGSLRLLRVEVDAARF